MCIEIVGLLREHFFPTTDSLVELICSCSRSCSCSWSWIQTTQSPCGVGDELNKIMSINTPQQEQGGASAVTSTTNVLLSSADTAYLLYALFITLCFFYSAQLQHQFGKLSDSVSTLYTSFFRHFSSHPPQVPSRSSNRNGKRSPKKKVKNKAKRRQESDNNLSTSNTCLLYMFASMRSGGYLLFRIDALEHSCKFNENNGLLPLLIFDPQALPAGFCTLVHIGKYIYFVGQKPHDVFKIRKDHLRDLTPGEDNFGSKYLIRMQKSMQGPKRSPLVFVANGYLYVISRDYSCESHEFEKYSPSDDSWTDLNPKPKGHGLLKAHVVLDNIAYFATTDETVLSCNLTDGCWSIVSTAPINPRTFSDIHPAFDAPVYVAGDMMIGAFKLPSDFNITVAASPHSRCDESVKHNFMRPTLAPESKFWLEFARRFDHICNDEIHGSHNMTVLQNLDGQNILCFVSYGSSPSTDEPHALLTFYQILGDHRKTTVHLEKEVLEGGDAFCYYARQVEKNIVAKSYFNTKFMHRQLFNITTTKLDTTGKLITCVAY